MRGLLTPLLPLTAGLLIGLLAWPHAIWIAPIIFLLLPLFRQWAAPFLAMLGYHLATTCGLIQGADDFFPQAGLALGVAFWLTTSIAFALPYLLYKPLYRLSNGSPWQDALFALLATLVTSGLSTVLPPLGLIGWTSPWIGAVDCGWQGVAFVLLMVASMGKLRGIWDADIEPLVGKAFMAALMLGIGTVALFAEGSWYWLPLGKPYISTNRPHVPAGWIAISTHGGHLTGISQIEESMRLVPRVLAALHTHRVVLLPETVAGYWGPGTQAVWTTVVRYTASHPHKTVLVGAAVPQGRGLSDALVEIHDGRTTVLPDRIPVPFSMWHPWHPQGSFTMRVFGKPEIATIDHTRVAYLICYEQLLMWPALSLLGEHPQVLLAPANDWWAQGTDIPAIQRASARAWGHLLGIPVLFAVNR